MRALHPGELSANRVTVTECQGTIPTTGRAPLGVFWFWVGHVKIQVWVSDSSGSLLSLVEGVSAQTQRLECSAKLVSVVSHLGWQHPLIAASTFKWAESSTIRDPCLDARFAMVSLLATWVGTPPNTKRTSTWVIT